MAKSNTRSSSTGAAREATGGEDGGKSSNKKKATARKHATQRSGRAPASTKQISQSRHPGETPLTGEDRPTNQRGGKKQGQRTGPTARKGAAGEGNAPRENPNTAGNRGGKRGSLRI